MIRIIVHPQYGAMRFPSMYGYPRRRRLFHLPMLRPFGFAPQQQFIPQLPYGSPFGSPFGMSSPFSVGGGFPFGAPLPYGGGIPFVGGQPFDAPLGFAPMGLPEPLLGASMLPCL